MRSAGLTKSAPPSLVVLATNSTMAFLAGPSFHDGSAGGDTSGDGESHPATLNAASAAKRNVNGCIDCPYSSARAEVRNGTPNHEYCQPTDRVLNLPPKFATRPS